MRYLIILFATLLFTGCSNDAVEKLEAENNELRIRAEQAEEMAQLAQKEAEKAMELAQAAQMEAESQRLAAIKALEDCKGQ